MRVHVDRTHALTADDNLPAPAGSARGLCKGVPGKRARAEGDAGRCDEAAAAEFHAAILL
jgi:hypothetical protein